MVPVLLEICTVRNILIIDGSSVHTYNQKRIRR